MSHAGKPMATHSGVVPISEVESVAQAAQRIGISTAYVYRMIRKGKIPAWELAGKLVVLKSDVDQLRKKSA